MERCGCELHSHLVADIVERHKVGGVLVLNRHAEAYILHTHLAEFLEGGVAALISVVETADLVVGLLQALYGDSDSYLRKLLAEVDDSIGEEAVGGDHYSVALFIEFPDNILEVGPDEWLATRNVGEIHLWEFLDGLDGDFLLGLARRLVSITHRATRITAVSHNDCTVKFFL